MNYIHFVFFFFSTKKYFKGKKLITSSNLLYKLWHFSVTKKKKANIGLSLISISGLSFLNLFLTVCPFPYYLIMLPCDCELSMGPGWLSHHFEFILEAATGRNKNLGQQLLVKIFLPVSWIIQSPVPLSPDYHNHSNSAWIRTGRTIILKARSSKKMFRKCTSSKL